MTQNLIEQLSELRNDLGGRDLHFVRPRVLSITDLYDHDNDIVTIAPPAGSIVIYYAASGETILDNLTLALLAKDSNQLKALGREVSSLLPKHSLPTETAILTELRNLPCLFDVRYKSKTVAENVGLLHGYTFGTITLAYTGGPITDEDFSIVEYRVSNDTLGYQYIIAKCAPILTDLERTIMEKIPSEYSEITVGRPFAADTVKEVADIVRDAAEKAKQTRGCRFDLLEELQEQIRTSNISPTAAARTLMQARFGLVNRSRSH